jgi:hypothetical protein
MEEIDKLVIGWPPPSPPDPLPDWDGLTGWYVQYLNQDPSWFDHPTSGTRLKKWYERLP